MFGADDFQKATNVSRETLDNFKRYSELLIEWQQKINLIGPATTEDIWHRHFYDSAQLLPLIIKSRTSGQKRTILDMGSGAGFPGLVLALMGENSVYLAEPSAKRCAFLRRVMRETGAEAKILQAKVKDIETFPVDIVTARALAPIATLIEWGLPYLREDGEFWLLKGSRVEEELTLAKKNWNMTTEIFPSKTGNGGKILKLSNIRMVGAA